MSTNDRYEQGILHVNPGVITMTNPETKQIYPVVIFMIIPKITTS